MNLRIPAFAVLLTACSTASSSPPSPDASAGDAGDAGAANTSPVLVVGDGGLTRQQLLDPQSCQTCHEQQYRQWSGSMHAYASDDPVFVAMNQRGQRETQGQLGSFCVQCHAPVALREGRTTDGQNLSQLDATVKGVTCYFCHQVDRLEADHDFNNPLHLAGDNVMRGAFADAVPNTAHGSAATALHDRDQQASSSLCGTCHDIVSGPGGHIERTFAEWKSSVFSQPHVGTTCSQCHMDQSKTLAPVANAPNVFARRAHDHSFPGVDVALTPFPDTDHQRQAVQAFLDSSLQSSLCVEGSGAASSLMVVLDNVAAGHGFPSGAAQDRRLWTEVIAYAGDRVIYQSGQGDNPGPMASANDPDLWMIRDCMYDVAGNETHMFWEGARSSTNQLPGQLTFSPTDPRFYQTHIAARYPRRPGGPSYLPEEPDRVTLRIRMRALGTEVIDDLVQSGDLAPTYRDKIATYVLGTTPVLEWTRATQNEVFSDGPVPLSCISKTNLSAKADKVLAQETCSGPIAPNPLEPSDGGLTVEAGDDAAADADVSCLNDPRVDTYTAGLEKVGALGALRIRVTDSTPAPPAKGSNRWSIQVTDVAGKAVEGATVTVDLKMPDHGHKNSVVPVVQSLGGGAFSLDPLYLFMAGVWRISITADVGGSRDTATFTFCIQG